MCGQSFHVVPSTGVMLRHGHTKSCPPCAGSGLPPLGADVGASVSPRFLDVAICQLPASSSAASFYLALYKLVKRIPKSARHRASIIFAKCFQDVVSMGDLPSWKRLLSFPPYKPQSSITNRPSPSS